MMWGYGAGYGWFGWLMGTILLALIVGLVVWLVTARSHPPQGQAPMWPTQPPRPDPLDILRERFARGEITLEEFETAKRALGYPSGAPPQQPPAAGPPAAG